MLSMKTLKVAIVAMGSALLLGPGLVTAVDIKLDFSPLNPSDADGMGEDAVVYALETLGDSTAVGKVKYYGLMAPDADAIVTGSAAGLQLVVRTKRAIESEEDVYLRLDLGGGLVFLAAPSTSDGGEPVTGGVNRPYVVFKLTDDTARANNTAITVDLADGLGVVAEAGAYTARITAYGDPDDASEGVGARSTLFGGDAAIIHMVQGLDVRVMSNVSATADVSVGFRWFVGPSNAQPVVAQKKLGWVSVAERVLDPAGTIKPLDATDGMAVDAAMDLVDAGGINIEVEGNLGVGAFSFVEDTATNSPNLATGIPNLGTATCPGATATADEPDQGTLLDEDGDKLVDEDGMVGSPTSGTQDFSLISPSQSIAGPAGVHDVFALCVNVDILGKETNTEPLPIEDYTGTVSITGPDPAADPQEAAAGTIGKIRRNGTAVKIAYLTVSDKYNQRLIISNRGATPALFDLGGFTTEDGTMVELSEAAKAARAAGLNMVPAKGQMVLRVADLLEFTGDRARAAATLSVNARSYNIQVATTQVNLEDGSTDTVVYVSEGGSGI